MTQNRLPKEDLIRVVRHGLTVTIDTNQSLPGRGAYITPDEDIIKQGKKRHAFARSFKANVETAIYDVLLLHIKDEVKES